MSHLKSKKKFLADNLRDGEKYAGLVLGQNGDPDHHLILLRGQAEDVSWESAKKWAEDQGGELPTRQEQSILYANLPAEFDKRAYWSGQVYEGDSGFAWSQYFSDGGQHDFHECLALRARAVRRLILE